MITYKEALRGGGSVFATPKRRAQLWASTRLRVDATLTRGLIIDIATDLKKSAETEQRVRAAALEGITESEDQMRPDGARGHKKNRRSKRGKRQ